jgi:hypothetical protein
MEICGYRTLILRKVRIIHCLPCFVSLSAILNLHGKTFSVLAPIIHPSPGEDTSSRKLVQVGIIALQRYFSLMSEWPLSMLPLYTLDSSRRPRMVPVMVRKQLHAGWQTRVVFNSTFRANMTPRRAHVPCKQPANSPVNPHSMQRCQRLHWQGLRVTAMLQAGHDARQNDGSLSTPASSYRVVAGAAPSHEPISDGRTSIRLG